MKAAFRHVILPFLILVFVISGCTQEKVYIDKPDLSLEKGKVDFADRTQYLVVEHNGLRGIFYYDLTEHCFKGSLENTTKHTVTGVSIDFIDDNGKTTAQCAGTDVLSKDIIQVKSSGSAGRYSGWTVRLVFNDGLPTKKIESDPILYTSARIKDGKVISHETVFMKKYENFNVIPNEGASYRGKVYAGRHQSFTIEKNGLLVSVEYSYELMGFNGSVQNISSDTKYNFRLAIVYGNGDKADSQVFGSMPPNQYGSVSLQGRKWDEFEVYRVEISFFGADGTYDFDETISIKDVF